MAIISVRVFTVYFFCSLYAINPNNRVRMYMRIVLEALLQGKNNDDDDNKVSENYTSAIIC